MKEDLLNKITLEEYQMMDSYRKDYAFLSSYSEENFISSRELLSTWAVEKQDLFSLFDGNLMLSKEIEYEKEEYNLSEEMEDSIYGYYDRTTATRKEHSGRPFYDNFLAWRNDTFPYVYRTQEGEDWEKRQKIRDGLNRLMNITNLVNNRFDNEPFTIPMPNGKKMQIQTGAKVMRILSKIASAYNIEGFEEFRLAHSLVLNQKKVKGTLTLSIHPLDYMTMSDNECGWDSCMSWREEGCYRQGTVEMMNSACVVVAYLNAQEPMEIGNSEWTNKKWRQLFIVTPELIFSVKAYPYHSDFLTLGVMEWLANLAERAWGFRPSTEEPIVYGDTGQKHLSFITCYMYNDVGTAPKHYLYYNKDWLQEREEEHKTTWTYFVKYSGPSQCMCCGSQTNDFCGEQSLVCDECEHTLKCADCGCYLDEEHAYEFGDELYCEDCYCDHVGVCDCCDENVAVENLYDICITANGEEISHPAGKYYCNTTFRICDSCLEDWLKGHSLPGAVYYYSPDRDCNTIYIDINSCETNVCNYYYRVSDEMSFKEYLQTEQYWMTMYPQVGWLECSLEELMELI